VSDSPWLRAPIGPDCWVTVLVSREPTPQELEMLIRYVRVHIEYAFPPTPAPTTGEPTP
jgi:hypothetical protein